MSTVASDAGVRQWSVVVLTFFNNFVFAGVIFGWAPMQLLLEEDGAYRELCSEFEPNCQARMERFVYLYTLGSTALVIGGAPCGFLVDWLGPCVCEAFSGLCTAAGLVLLGVSDSQSFDAFAVGCLLVGFGGCFIMMSSVPAAFIMPPKHMPVIFAMNNCAFDASTLAFLVLYQIYARSGLNRRSLLIGYALICLFSHIALSVAWGGRPSALLRQIKSAEVHSAENAAQPPIESHGDDVVPESASKLHGMSLRQQMRSPEFRIVLLFFSLSLFRSNAYLGTNKLLLQNLGDEATGYTYTQVFAVFLPASAVCAPAIGCFMSLCGCRAAFLLTAVLGLIWNAAALVPSLPVQVLSFTAFTNFRAILYSVHFAYLAQTFGSRTVGRVHGAMSIVGACLNFLIWPCVAAARHFNGGDLTYLYTFLLVLGILPLAGALRLSPQQRPSHPKPPPIREVRIFEL